jgi:dCTP deaminase
MILSAQSIRQRCQCNPPLIDPFVERTMSPGGNSFGLGPASYDVRLDQRLVLPPHGFTLASTLERFSMPADLAGVVRGKSTWARDGISVFNTLLDPGWSGFLTLEIVNHLQDEIIIAAGEPIAQIEFEMLDLPTEQPYGFNDTGKYQNQERGPQPARREMANRYDEF